MDPAGVFHCLASCWILKQRAHALVSKRARQPALFWTDAEASISLLRRPEPSGHVLNPDSARSPLQLTRQGFHENRLAAARRADDHCQDAGRNGYRHIVQRRNGAEAHAETLHVDGASGAMRDGVRLRIRRYVAAIESFVP